MTHVNIVRMAWSAVVSALVVALLSLAPFVGAITLNGALVPLFAYTAWRGAWLPSGMGLLLCAAAFIGSPLPRDDVPDLLLAMAAMWGVAGSILLLWRMLRPRRS